MHTDIAVLLFILLLSAVLYLPTYFSSRKKARNPKVTDIQEFRDQHKNKIKPTEVKKKRLP